VGGLQRPPPGGPVRPARVPGSESEAVAFSNRADLLAVLDHLGIERAAVVGTSRGGTISIDFALEYPARVWAVVPIGGGISGKPDVEDPPELTAYQEMERLENSGDFGPLVELEARFWLDGPAQPEGRVASSLRERFMALDAAEYAQQQGRPEPAPQPLDPPAFGRLEEIAVPVLVVVGEYDTSESLANAEEMARRIPGARKVVVASAAHMLHMERPDEFNRLVLDFLAQVAPDV
jgi:pimeloyl-ACP methyl ester carboxylesterase